ncbi:uncharacterized protein LOC111211081 [Brassica napus]|nr:uncharacterized protein LOC111211081 [Brassica napus]
MTQELFTQFTAAARYIWGGSMIHNIHYEVSENTSDVVYKIIDSLCSWLLRKRQIKLNGQKDKRISSTTCGGPTRRTYHRRRRGLNHRPLLLSLSHIGVQLYLFLFIF